MSKFASSPQRSVPSWLAQHRIVSVPQMADALGYSVAHLRRLYREGKVPRPTSIGGRKLGWPASTLIALVDGKQMQSDEAA